jgi:hypothetical protein
MLNFINALLGGALLLAGRRIYWLFVGVAGFVVGILLSSRFFHGPEWMTILVGLGLGILFALLAVFVQGIAIAVAGFLGGGYILLTLAGMFGLDKGALAWIIYIIGGIIGVTLIGVLFDWAIITISSLVGASMIVEAFHLQRVAGGVVLLVLVIVGVAVQGAALRSTKREHRESD